MNTGEVEPLGSQLDELVSIFVAIGNDKLIQEDYDFNGSSINIEMSNHYTNKISANWLQKCYTSLTDNSGSSSPSAEDNENYKVILLKIHSSSDYKDLIVIVEYFKHFQYIADWHLTHYEAFLTFNIDIDAPFCVFNSDYGQNVDYASSRTPPTTVESPLILQYPKQSIPQLTIAQCSQLTSASATSISLFDPKREYISPEPLCQNEVGFQRIIETRNRSGRDLTYYISYQQIKHCLLQNQHNLIKDNVFFDTILDPILNKTIEVKIKIALVQGYYILELQIFELLFYLVPTCHTKDFIIPWRRSEFNVTQCFATQRENQFSLTKFSIIKDRWMPDIGYILQQNQNRSDEDKLKFIEFERQRRNVEDFIDILLEYSDTIQFKNLRLGKINLDDSNEPFSFIDENYEYFFIFPNVQNKDKKNMYEIIQKKITDYKMI